MPSTKPKFLHLFLLPLLIAALALGSAGCGDDSDSGGDGGAGTASQDPSKSSDTPSEEGNDSGSGEEAGSQDDGSQDGGSQSNSPLTKAEFIDSANAICRSSEAKIASEVGAFEKESGKSVEQLQAKSMPELHEEIFQPILREEVEELRALTPPKGSSKQVEAILVATEQQIDAPVSKSVTSLPAYRARFSEALKLADQYGIGACPIT